MPTLNCGGYGIRNRWRAAGNLHRSGPEISVGGAHTMRQRELLRRNSLKKLIAFVNDSDGDEVAVSSQYPGQP
jgi:hypothetical protein